MPSSRRRVRTPKCEDEEQHCQSAAAASSDHPITSLCEAAEIGCQRLEIPVVIDEIIARPVDVCLQQRGLHAVVIVDIRHRKDRPLVKRPPRHSPALADQDRKRSHSLRGRCRRSCTASAAAPRGKYRRSSPLLCCPFHPGWQKKCHRQDRAYFSQPAPARSHRRGRQKE